jgi:hypothetical protein
MARLLIHVEGQTEEDFVNEVLRGHLLARGYDAVSARIMGNARLRQNRGGIRPWPSVRRDIIRHLLEDPACIATTMVDYYGLPQTGAGAWPGRSAAIGLTTAAKGECVETAIWNDIVAETGDRINPKRFIPFVVMHEFEGLLFSDCIAFSRGIYRPDLAPRLQKISDQFTTPEDINDSSLTAPSKRLRDLFPEYQKPLLGSLAAFEIGLGRIRVESPHFDGWLKLLEKPPQ